MSEYIKNLKKPVAIIGMGKSGAAAQRLLLAAGVAAQDIATYDATYDNKQASAQYQDVGRLLAEVQPKTLVVSPGVPLSLAWIQQAIAESIHITSELTLACSTLLSEKIIGVTGSVGKSTTVSILGAGLASFSESFFVGGNLGYPLADYAADLLENRRTRAVWVVLELSSYQLENCMGLKLDFSVITYLTPNHLERYTGLDDYYRTKWLIEDITKNHVILNHNGGDLRNFLEKQKSAKILWSEKHLPALKDFNLSEAILIGEHNQDNLAMASLVALKAGWPESSITAMKAFSGLTHRLENIGFVKGIRFINDSKATAMDSVLIAAQAANSSRPANGKLYILLGGRDKNLPWEKLHSLSLLKSTFFVFFGECRELAKKKSQLNGSSFSSLREAFRFCIESAHPKDSILLSPGGTSLDEFSSFEDRGNFFKAQIELFAKT